MYFAPIYDNISRGKEDNPLARQPAEDYDALTSTNCSIASEKDELSLTLKRGIKFEVLENGES